MPHKNVSHPRYIIGGYSVGLLVGSLGWLYYTTFSFANLGLICAITIGISIFIMVITNTEHPPAAAFAFGIVVDGFNLNTIIIIYFVTIFFMLIKRFTKKWLIDLL